MHNLIQELRGNVRVFARVRPFLPGDGVDEDTEPCIVPKSDTTLKIVRDTRYKHKCACWITLFVLILHFSNIFVYAITDDG